MGDLLDILRENLWKKPSGPTGIQRLMDQGVSVPKEFLRASTAPFLTGAGVLLGIAQGLKETGQWLGEALQGGARSAVVLGEEGDPSFLGRGLFATADLLVGGAPGGGTGIANAFRKASPRAIAAAEALLAKGKSVEEAARVTGAWRTKAGWVSEMSDEGFQLKKGLEHFEGMTLPLEEVIRHPSFLAEFPELARESMVRITEAGRDPGFVGYKEGRGGMITLGTEATREDAIHELTHLTAREEGLAQGTNSLRELFRLGGEHRLLELQDKLKAIPEKWGPEPGKWPLSVAREHADLWAELSKLSQSADRAYWRNPGEMLAREAESRMYLSDKEKALWPLSEELLLRAGSKEMPFFSALVRNWANFRAGKGAGQKFFTPEQLGARLKQMASKDELLAGGYLEVLDRLPRGTKLPAEKVDRWLQRGDLSKKVRVHRLEEGTKNWEKLLEGVSGDLRVFDDPEEAFETYNRLKQRYETGAEGLSPEFQKEMIRYAQAKLDELQPILKKYNPLKYDPDVQEYIRLNQTGARWDEIEPYQRIIEERYPERAGREGTWEQIFGPGDPVAKPKYPMSYLHPFRPFGKGDYWEELIAYDRPTLGVKVGARKLLEQETAARKVRQGELADMLLGAGPKSEAVKAEEQAWLKELGETFDYLQEKFVEALEKGNWAEEARWSKGYSEILNQYMSFDPNRSARERILKEGIRKYSPDTGWNSPELQKELRDLYHEYLDLTYSSLPSVEEFKLLAKPVQADVMHYGDVDPGTFGFGRMVRASDPELGQGTYGLEIQSNLYMEKGKQIGPFLEKGVSPIVDAALYNAAKRGDKFFAVPLRETIAQRWQKDPSAGYVKHIYGEEGSAVRRLVQQLRKVGGEKVQPMRRMLEFSSGRSGEKQYQEAIVVPIPPKARENILKKGFKISKNESLLDVVRRAFYA